MSLPCGYTSTLTGRTLTSTQPHGHLPAAGVAASRGHGTNSTKGYTLSGPSAGLLSLTTLRGASLRAGSGGVPRAGRRHAGDKGDDAGSSVFASESVSPRAGSFAAQEVVADPDGISAAAGTMRRFQSMLSRMPGRELVHTGRAGTRAADAGVHSSITSTRPRAAPAEHAGVTTTGNNIVGRLHFSRDVLMPVTLAAAKWGRIRSVTHSSVAAEPSVMAVEVQRAYHDAFLDEVQHATAGAYRFDMEAEPTAFAADIGGLNRLVAAAGAAAREAALITSDTTVEADAALQPVDMSHALIPQDIFMNTRPRDRAVLLDKLGVPSAGGSGAPTASPGWELVPKRGALGESVAIDSTLRVMGEAVPAEDVTRLEEAITAARAAQHRANVELHAAATAGDAKRLHSLLHRGVQAEVDSRPWHLRGGTANASAAAAAGVGAYVLPDVNAPLSHAHADAISKPQNNGSATAAVKGDTPLMTALRAHSPECVKLLLAAGADARRQNSQGLNAIRCAVQLQAEASAALKRHDAAAGARVRAAAEGLRMVDDRSILEASRDGDLLRVRALVERDAVPVNSCNAYGMTPLHFAVMNRDCPLITLLIRHGADVDALNNVGQSPRKLLEDVRSAATRAKLNDALQAGEKEDAARREKLQRARKVREDEVRLLHAFKTRLRALTRGTTAAKTVAALRELPPLRSADLAAAAPPARRAASAHPSPDSHAAAAAPGSTVATALRPVGLFDASTKRHARDLVALTMKADRIRSAATHVGGSGATSSLATLPVHTDDDAFQQLLGMRAPGATDRTFGVWFRAHARTGDT